MSARLPACSAKLSRPDCLRAVPNKVAVTDQAAAPAEGSGTWGEPWAGYSAMPILGPAAHYVGQTACVQCQTKSARLSAYSANLYASQRSITSVFSRLAREMGSKRYRGAVQGAGVPVQLCRPDCASSATFVGQTACVQCQLIRPDCLRAVPLYTPLRGRIQVCHHVLRVRWAVNASAALSKKRAFP